MAAAFKVGDEIEFVSGGRFGRSQVFGPHGQELLIGQAGFIHAIPGVRGELGCTFGSLKVSLDSGDVKLKCRPPANSKSQRRNKTLPAARSLSHHHSLPIMSETGLHIPSRKGHVGRLCNAVSLLRLGNENPITKEAGRDKREADACSEISEVSSTSSGRDRPHPPSFYCPISRQCMHDPVVLTDGHTYERRYIEQWLEQRDTSPVSGAKLRQKAVFPNHALRNAIEEYFQDVLLTHREAIRDTTAGLLRRQGKFSSDTSVVNTINALMQCSVLVNADLSVELVLKRIMDEAKSLLGAEAASVFLVDRENRELYSTVNSTGTELRIPFDSGVAGHVAASREPVIIPDAYADARFNNDVDRATGFKTRNILCVPIRASKAGIIGVAQLINKIPGGVFSAPSSDEAECFDQELHPAFTQDDQCFFEVFASQAGSAIVSSGIMLRMPKAPAPETNRPSIVHNSSKSGCKILSPSSSQYAPADDDTKDSQAAAAPDCPKKLSSPAKCSKADLSAVQIMTLEPILESAFASWEADALTICELSNKKPLSLLAFDLIEKNSLIEYFSLDRLKLTQFLTEIEFGYPDNHYHGRAHAASVVHVTHALLLHGGLAELAMKAAEGIEEARQSKFVMLAGLIAAAMHDFEHEGTSNDFHVKTLSERAITYNNRSVNEQHHAAEAFRILLKPECNFLCAMPGEEFQRLRSLILDMVLATDMAEHKQILASFNEMTSSSPPSDAFVPSDAKEAVLTLKMAMKCADLGHLSLNWSSHLRWVRRLEEEFFQQGDKEKKLWMPVSSLMDRDKPGVSESQMGFFNFVVLPLYRSYLRAFPSTAPLVSAVEDNFAKWSSVQAKLNATTAAAATPANA
eukprot:TRINITY_DN57149_c0_g1_i1.p1 TRINITY_DN57149_c0_g1~~TRINITY_DN57149_c0_g1_i1.p1  ORF type:complete len:859 (+),score=161.86 TRINITY_DN57149_c0_g1_i1:105-2681(+)